MGVNHLTVKPATAEDSVSIYRIASDPLVRQLALNPDGFSFESHQTWFLGKLLNPDYLILVIREKKQIVACVRYEKTEQSVEAHLAVAPEFWGRGIATGALQQTRSEALKRWGALPLIAHILPGHDISKRVFAKAGYQFVEQTLFKGRSVEKWCLQSHSAPGG